MASKADVKAAVGRRLRCIENCAARLRALGVSAVAKPNKPAPVGGLINANDPFFGCLWTVPTCPNLAEMNS